jgi:hypothetical protein
LFERENVWQLVKIADLVLVNYNFYRWLCQEVLLLQPKLALAVLIYCFVCLVALAEASLFVA